MMRRLLSCVWIVLAISVLPTSAQRLPATVTPEHYDLAFTVALAHNRFDGAETIRVQAPRPTTTVVLHAVDIVFREVTIGDGATAQPATVTKDAAAQTATLTVPR